VYLAVPLSPAAGAELMLHYHHRQLLPPILAVAAETAIREIAAQVQVSTEPYAVCGCCYFHRGHGSTPPSLME